MFQHTVHDMTMTIVASLPARRTSHRSPPTQQGCSHPNVSDWGSAVQGLPGAANAMAVWDEGVLPTSVPSFHRAPGLCTHQSPHLFLQKAIEAVLLWQL